MKRLWLTVIFLASALLALDAQTLEDARNMYRAGLYEEALPIL